VKAKEVIKILSLVPVVIALAIAIMILSYLLVPLAIVGIVALAIYGYKIVLLDSKP
jgi:hypothetical protein